ncbi:hypothetical protein HO839_07420 [Streptococcus suis]|nr:hypothetical protein [Streptococcus suis]
MKMIIVTSVDQGELNRIEDKTLEEVQTQYKSWFPLTFDELRFEEIS